MASIKRKRSDPQLTQRRASRSGKLPVAEPTSFKKFFIMLSMHICRKILIVDTWYKLAIYICTLTIGSLIADVAPVPKTYFANSKNSINIYFVKLGWGWTCGLLLAFVYMTSFTYCCGNIQRVKKHLSRLLIATVYWYICTSFFERVDRATGFCSNSELPNEKDACRDGKGTWLSFDISGHAFLLIHCLLTISEEVKCVQSWERIDDLIQNDDRTALANLTTENKEVLKESFYKFTPFVRILMGLLSFLQIMWEIMLLATIIYFHNLPQKVAGAAFASVGWFVTYHLWYKMDSEWAPEEVGKGLVKYQKTTVRRL